MTKMFLELITQLQKDVVLLNKINEQWFIAEVCYREESKDFYYIIKHDKNIMAVTADYIMKNFIEIIKPKRYENAQDRTNLICEYLRTGNKDLIKGRGIKFESVL